MCHTGPAVTLPGDSGPLRHEGTGPRVVLPPPVPAFLPGGCCSKSPLPRTRLPRPRPRGTLSQACNTPQPAVSWPRSHKRSLLETAATGQGWPPRQCLQQPLQPPRPTQQPQRHPCPNCKGQPQRPSLQAFLPPVPTCHRRLPAATGHSGPAHSPHGAHHREEKKQTPTRASEAQHDLAPPTSLVSSLAPL